MFMVVVLAGWVLGAVALGLVIGAAVRMADRHEADAQWVRTQWHAPVRPVVDRAPAPVVSLRQAG